jgi:hypothetical protein
MRVLLSATRGGVAESSWQVEVEGRPARSLRQLPNGFPVPVDSQELAALPAEVRSLWDPSPDGLARTYANILTGTPAAGDLQRFGRYLFETLLGQAAWQRLQGRCPPGEPLELALQWEPGAWELSRLFWEMMHDGTGFLAESRAPEVSVVRQVPGSEGTQEVPKLGLRVLFVVGTSLADTQIRPGAEYLGLLRRLESRQRALTHRMVLSASGEALAEAVRTFQPTVLHLTCHGEWGSVRLMRGPEDPPAVQKAGYRRWSAQELVALLRGTGAALPTVVVLNACDSASGRPVSPAQAAAGKAPEPSFAAELVRLGTPLVVGMAGRVADHACRLFTRQLYESLLECPPGESVDVGQATAAGRRAGLRLLGSRLDTSDWLFPQLWARSEASTRLELTDVAEASARERVARSYRASLPFCDRFDTFSAFAHWLDSGDCERTLLALVGPSVEREPVKYGATRVLQELAAQAIHSGHVPVLLSLPEGSPEAWHPLALVKELRNELNAVRRAWGLQPTNLSELTRLLVRKTRPEEPLHPEVEAELAGGELTDPNVIRMALCLDLAVLAAQLPGRRVLLMLDALHMWTPGLPTVVRMLEEGLGYGGMAFPVVVSCRRWPENAKVDQALKTLLERQAVRTHPLGRFQPEQEPLAYHQYVVLRQPAHVPDPQDPKAPVLLEQIVGRLVEGVPSRLHDNDQLEAMLEVLANTRVLLPADDEAALRALLQQPLPAASGARR